MTHRPLKANINKDQIINDQAEEIKPLKSILDDIEIHERAILKGRRSEEIRWSIKLANKLSEVAVLFVGPYCDDPLIRYHLLKEIDDLLTHYNNT